MSETLRIGTRKSPLALWQAEHVKARLEAEHAGLSVELVKIVTTGDKVLDVPLARVGGKALFVKEIEERLRSGEVDVAVHSMKDVPTILPDGLGLSATSARHDPRDAFVAKDPRRTPGFAALPEGARLGTSSLRRACQAKARRPDLEIVSIRGNVGTRLGKLETDDLDAEILAVAGLERLGFADRITERMDVADSLPAIGQGALGIETRLGDARVRSLVACLDDAVAGACVAAERALLHRLEGGCQVPIGGHCVPDGEGLWLRALVADLEGTTIVRAEARCGTREPTVAEALGREVAETLLEGGADRILAEVYAATAKEG